MAKKSQRRTVRYEKDKSGCMWGFISMFDFRHGHLTRKLIADKRQSTKHSGGKNFANIFRFLQSRQLCSFVSFCTQKSLC
jgi:hypothetical protein